MFRDFLDMLHRNGLLVDIIVIKFLINFIVVSVFMMVFRGATGTKIGDILQFLSSILIITVISYCAVEFFHWHLYITPMVFGFFGDIIVSKIVAKGFREKFISSLFVAMLNRISALSKLYFDNVIENKIETKKESKSDDVKEEAKEDGSNVKTTEGQNEVSEEVRKRLRRKRRTDRH